MIQANPPTLDNETYSYDKVGNRLSELLGDTNTGKNTNTGQWQYNARDQLISTPLNNFQYDTQCIINSETSQLVDTANNGNRIQSTTNGVLTNYVYNANDWLLSAGSVAYTYDASGNTLTETDGGQVTTYRYDGLG
ncbi:hypothetical protein [Ostreibacterium oceani]|uniref:YD repeat-containing protein n=1 Tax=Ostreibacterium oceani TaxID=2654998 RepID=A0A6N7EUF9_9GAMM|nr:hypothetical protein [Ostreibacterium oceani]MPV86191.1 hypothetical protein [Ostreibacterium oceani]